MIVLLIRFEALPSVRIAVLFCCPFCGHSKPKNPTASREPTVGNERALVALGGLLSLYLAATAGDLTAATAFSGGATGLHTTSEVVAGKHDLEVVGDKGAHEAVRIADLVLRLVRLHHGEVSIRAIRRWRVFVLSSTLHPPFGFPFAPRHESAQHPTASIDPFTQLFTHPLVRSTALNELQQRT